MKGQQEIKHQLVSEHADTVELFLWHEQSVLAKKLNDIGGWIETK